MELQIERPPKMPLVLHECLCRMSVLMAAWNSE